jgi:hypothetical protein
MDYNKFKAGQILYSFWLLSLSVIMTCIVNDRFILIKCSQITMKCWQLRYRYTVVLWYNVILETTDSAENQTQKSNKVKVT